MFGAGGDDRGPGPSLKVSPTTFLHLLRAQIAAKPKFRSQGDRDLAGRVPCVPWALSSRNGM